MFQTIVLLAYSIPGIYLFFRIWSLFIEKRHRIIYFLVFAFLYSLYPVSRAIDERSAGTVDVIIESITGYLLPYFLYIFLTVLLIDLLLLVNIVFRIIPPAKIRDRHFRNRIFAGSMIFPGVVVMLGVINFNLIRTTEFSVEVERKTSIAGDLKIAFVSDLHLEERVPVRFIERFAEKTGEISPDIVLLGGDIVEGGRMNDHMKRFEEILSGIKTRYGVYGVPGNHDGYGRSNVLEFMKRSGIVYLRDSVIVFDSSFVLAGRKDSRSPERLAAGDLVSKAGSDLPVIVLDHRPTDYEAISASGADIVLSGHSHHGQLFPLNFITGKVYELSYGYLKKGNTHFFVSSGLRLWGFPVRTTAKSEIMVINVTFR